MNTRFLSKHFLSFGYILSCNNSGTSKHILPAISQIRFNSKHWNPKFKKERRDKVIKIELLDFDEKRRDEKLSIAEIRAKLKEKGIAPTRPWEEKPMHISCSTDIFDPYIPPEGDGKLSLISSGGAKQTYELFGKKSKSYLALKKIRKIDYEFDVPTLAEKAKDIYVEAQKALSQKNEDKLHELATEKAFPEMMENVKKKTIVWNLIQCLEPPRIVQVRLQELMQQTNKFAQVTLKLHTQQTLAIYDRFGRLMHGSEDTVKDVLEYIVFEKHITDPNGVWRIHGKIIPDWLPPRDQIKKTYCRPDVDKEFPEPPPPTESSKQEMSEKQADEVSLATA